ncbi:Selenocysteine lyase [Nymphon striatum]|nr:Selenocysteine lyase [Nymphon striatum]
MLENNWTNPFSNQPSDLVSMSTGAAATSAITSDLLKARSKGEKAFKIHKERLESGSGFFDPIKKQNLQTFTVLQKNVVVNAGTNREMILKADNRVFGNMLLIAKSRKLDMKDVLQYPLGPKPWALANADGTLKKTGKATLGNHLEKEVANVDLPPCKDALKQQTNRANYQAAIWRRSLQNSPEIPSPTNGHGWNVVEGKLGLTGAPAPDVVLELMSCKCPRRCNENCPCVPVSKIKEYLQIINEPKRRSGLCPVHLHTDAAQAIGKIEVNVSELGVDFLTIVGHKFYGPRIGAVYAKNLSNSCLQPIFYGGGQEKGYRAGTENTGMIAGLGKAAELVSKNLNSYYISMKEKRGYLESKLVKKFGKSVCLLGARSGVDRIPNTCSVAFIGKYCSGKLILNMCSWLIASVGAACHSDSSCEGSAVLIASGVSPEIARNAIRLSVGRETTEREIDIAVDDLYESFNKIEAGIYQTEPGS